MAEQKSLFGEICSDLPLFSGTAPRARESQFRPGAAPRQLAMLCKFCHGTGLVVVKKNKPPVKCPCAKGETE